jgi:hypothetical protein
MKFSVQFYDYNTNNYRFDRCLRNGDVIESIEFNTDTQLYDIKVRDGLESC